MTGVNRKGVPCGQCRRLARPCGTCRGPRLRPTSRGTHLAGAAALPADRQEGAWADDGRPALQAAFDTALQSPDCGRERFRLTTKYSFAVPTAEAVDRLVELGPVVEIGAGTGYWARLIEDSGGTVVAYDAVPTSDGYNGWHGDAEPWADVRLGGPEKAADHPDSTLLLSWPPYDTTMAEDALRHYTGSTVVYIGEGMGGCTATDEFHQALWDDWEQVKEIDLPNWPAVHDLLTVLRRRTSA